MKKTNKNMKMGGEGVMGLGAHIGKKWGVSVYVSSGMGLALGLCAGMLIGMGLGAIKDNAVNIDKDGNIEQAYDDEDEDE